MKNKNHSNPFENLVLNDYEQELENAFEKGPIIPVSKKESEQIKKIFQEAIKTHKELRSSKKITIRVNQADLIKLKVKATKKNIPYQTLLSALIRSFVEGDYSIRL